MLKKSVMTMAAALFVMSVHAADAAQPAPAAKPEAAAPANDAAAQDPVEAALSAMGGAPAPAEKPAAGGDAPPAANATPANSAPPQGLAAGTNGAAKGAAAPTDKPAAAETQASQAPTQAPTGDHMRQPRNEESGGRYAAHREGRKPATEGAGAKPGATQQIDWTARRAERQAKRAASQGKDLNSRHATSRRHAAEATE